MTLAELYRNVLEKLEVVASDTPADPSDVQKVRVKYANLYEMLSAENLVSWVSSSDVPDQAAQPVISMLAFMCAAEFGKDPAPYAGEGAFLMPTPSLAERQLRRQAAPPYIPTIQETEYF